MKCTNCGKNNAVYHYCVQINGQTREAHLCPERAGKLQPEREFASESRSLLERILRPLRPDGCAAH